MKNIKYKNIVKKHSGKIYSYALYFLHNKQDAEDVTQEIFIKLWKNMDNVDTKRIVPWLMRVTHNHCIDLIRQQKDSRSQQKILRTIDWEICDYIEESEKNPEMSFESKERRRILLKAMQNLPENVKSIMLLHYFQGLKYSEISNLFDLNENTVKVTVHRGRKILREILQNKFPEQSEKYYEN